MTKQEMAAYLYKCQNMLSAREERDLVQLLSSPGTPPELFFELFHLGSRADHPLSKILPYLAGSPQCPPDVLVSLFSLSEFLSVQVIKNPNLEAKFLSSLFDSLPNRASDFALAYSRHPGLPYEVLERFVEVGQGAQVIEHPNMTDELRERLFDHVPHNYAEDWFLAGYPTLPRRVLERLAQSNFQDVRGRLAARKDLPDEFDFQLALDLDPRVVKDLTRNWGVPERYRRLGSEQMSVLGDAWWGQFQGEYWLPPRVEGLVEELLEWKSQGRPNFNVIPKGATLAERKGASTNIFGHDLGGKGISRALLFHPEGEKMWELLGAKAGRRVQAGVGLPPHVDAICSVMVNEERTTGWLSSEIASGIGQDYEWGVTFPLENRPTRIWGKLEAGIPDPWEGEIQVRRAGILNVNGRYMLARWERDGQAVGWTVEADGAGGVPSTRGLWYKETQRPLIQKAQKQIGEMVRSLLTSDLYL